jgi:hypothetical protein
MSNFELKIDISSDFTTREYVFEAHNSDLNIVVTSEQFEFILYDGTKEITRSRKSPNYHLTELISKKLVSGKEYKLLLNYTGSAISRFLYGHECKIITALVRKIHE